MSRLERLFRPRSIAVFGGAQAAAVIEQSRKMGFSGAIWPVHPSRETVAGLPAYRSVDALPEAPDAAFVGVNRHLTVDIVRALAARGTGGAVCYASGFAEAGADDAEGAALQAALVAAAGPMPIVGPNCYGLINYADGALLWPDQHGGRRLDAGGRGVAILTQSSNIAINLTMQRRGLPLAHVMTAGNQAQTGLSEMALGLVEDPRVSALGLHVEGFDSVAGFERLAARARALGKPVVAFKAGRSEQARTAALSHTASLAGSDAAADAFLRRLGIARVGSVPALLETLKLLHAGGPLAGPRLSSMSCSGGEASLMADAAAGRAVGFPALDAAHRAAIKATLSPLVAVANPLDYHTFIWNDRPALTATFSAMLAGGFDLNLLVLDFPRADRCADDDWWPTADAFADALAATGARGAVVATMAENLPEAAAERLAARGVAPLMGVAEALEAAEAAAAIGAAWRAAPAAPVTTSVASNPAAAPRTLGEAEAKARLAAGGLPVPAGRVAATAGEAQAAAAALGFPVAVKALGLSHKSERGGVRLGLGDAASVAAAAAALLPLGDGLLVERMVEDGVAELIVGVTRDPVFGPVLTLGTGGILVELLGDTATLLLPATRAAIEDALGGLKLFALLDGYRGRPRGDVAAAVDAIAAIAGFAVDQAGRLDELDVNPLIVRRAGAGAVVADALMVGRFEGVEPSAAPLAAAAERG
ncbi:acetate--CoA ligase family protein [Aquibium sp. A9E412]|uniref:acetate--CoA ligase family protein n=1 Tax=Aquibium sp. A9E412 TaxID=2976767 RepID=UPI0025AED563|nr:acetate--CoA ligase family protein [Aquibium sp. A9E412]MDN2565171.1 acetate--CoA ligase family protein [Aquibium sp. A9E412]